MIFALLVPQSAFALFTFSYRGATGRNACGVYGDEDLHVSQSSANSKDGQITLSSPKRVLLRGGGGLLLTVLAQPAVQTVK